MEKTLYENGIFEFINEEKIYTINGMTKNITRSFVRRPPGIRRSLAFLDI